MFDKIINKWAIQRGYRIGIGEIGLLDRVAKELEKQRDAHEIDPIFFKENLSFFEEFDDLETNQNQVVIVVAVPRPAHYVGFSFDTKIMNMVLPPTYVNYRNTFAEIRRDLEKNVFNEQIGLRTLTVPLKTLTSYLGIASYGKNNLTYIPEFGSYFQLVGYLINAPFHLKNSVESSKKRLMQKCKNCSACIKACPMGAISNDRFLLHAEKCFTLYSESSKDIPTGVCFPSPNCIIGCLKCQEICPMNQGKLKYENSGVLFSIEETLAILNSDEIPPKLLETIETKYSALGLTEGTEIFFRNFKNLVQLNKKMKKSMLGTLN